MAERQCRSANAAKGASRNHCHTLQTYVTIITTSLFPKAAPVSLRIMLDSLRENEQTEP